MSERESIIDLTREKVEGDDPIGQRLSAYAKRTIQAFRKLYGNRRIELENCTYNSTTKKIEIILDDDERRTPQKYSKRCRHPQVVVEVGTDGYTIKGLRGTAAQPIEVALAATLEECDTAASQVIGELRKIYGQERGLHMENPHTTANGMTFSIADRERQRLQRSPLIVTITRDRNTKRIHIKGIAGTLRNEILERIRCVVGAEWTVEGD